MTDNNKFPEKIIRIIAQRASFLCSKPDCRVLTTAAPLSGAGVDMVGEAAHIIAASSDGPRGKEPLDKHHIPSITSEENALWLCSIHHKQIDSHPGLYPVETLLAWKSAAEDFTRQYLGRNPFQPLPSSLTYTPPLLPDPNEIPPCSILPPGSHLPFDPNDAFTGRIEELLSLAHHLLYATQNRPTAITQPAALSGSGGIGKTQLAVEFCYRYGQYFYAVHWLQADQDLNPQIALCGQKMGLTPWPEKQPDLQVALTLQAWQRQPHRLVVLDNLTDPQLLLELPPELRAVKLLITSRRAAYDPTLGVRLRQLELLPRPDSLALLRKLAPRLALAPDSDLDPLAGRLGDYPLALHLAGMYLNKVQFTSPAAYLKQLDQPGNALDQAFLAEWKKTNPTRYEHNASQAFLLSWDQLDPHDTADALTRRFFLAAGFCAVNTPIPPEIFRQIAGETSDDISTASALERLQTLGLAATSVAGPLLHPLLAEFARLQDAASPESALPNLVDSLTTASKEVIGIGVVSGFLPLLPHLRQAGDHCRQSYPQQAALMYNQLGYLLKAMGDSAAARPYYEQALAINREVLGEKHPDTASSLNNLGSLLDSMGDYAAARPYYEQALAIRKEVLGEKHPDTASSLNNLGSLLDSMGDYAAARPYYEQALAIRKEVLGERHPDTASSLNNLGYLLQALGDYAAARPYYEQALAIKREVLGEKHPDTANSLNNLGALLYSMGDYAAARPYYEQALAIRKEVLGEKHPDTANSLNNLGSLLDSMGDYAAARPYYEQALAIHREVLGEKHPDTASSLNNLGYLLDSMGDYAAARPYYEQALAIRKEVLGEKHPDTASSLNNLGSLLDSMGDYAAARPYYEQALAIKREVLGEKHPDTALSLNNLGGLHQAMGDYAAARPYYEQALAIKREVLGEKHPATAFSLNNLGSLLKAMGDSAAARPYYEQALAIFESTLGLDHPYTQTVRANLSSLL